MSEILSEIKLSGDGSDVLHGDGSWSVITPNATHTGDVAGATALTIDKSAITGRTNVVAAVGDSLLISDVSNSDNLKKTTVQSVIDLVPPYTLAIGNSISGGTTNKLLAIGSLTALTQLTLGTKLSISGGALNVASLAIGDAVGSGTASSILFIDASGNLGEANSTFQRNSSGNFGIGTTADASYRLTLSAASYFNLKLSGTNPLIKFAPTSYLSGNGAEMYQGTDGVFRFNVNSSVNGFNIDGSGNAGFGVVASGARLHILSTSTQAKFGYDASNYATIAVSSAGAVTLDAVGSGAKFIFSDAIQPASMADSAAANNSIYYSTTAGKLVFKDNLGAINNLY